MRKKKNEEDKREISVSVDRVKLTLERYRNKKSFMAEIFSYLGSILTLLITIVTAQYNDFWFLSAAALEGVFITLLVIMVLVFIFRFCYVIFVKKSVYDENSFIDSLEYNDNVKTIDEINWYKKIWITVLLTFGALLIIGAFIGFGFLFKWHLFFDIAGAMLCLGGLIGYLVNWNDMFNFIYNKVKRNEGE